MQKLDKLNFQIKFIANAFMGYNINNKLTFTDSFKFLSFLLNFLVKNLGKDDFKYLSQEFNSDALDLAK